MKLLSINCKIKVSLTFVVKFRCHQCLFWHSLWYLLVHYKCSFKYNWELWWPLLFLAKAAALVSNNLYTPVADLRGPPSVHTPYSPKFSQFHAVFWKVFGNCMLAPPSEGWYPLLWEILDLPLQSSHLSFL